MTKRLKKFSVFFEKPKSGSKKLENIEKNFRKITWKISIKHWKFNFTDPCLKLWKLEKFQGFIVLFFQFQWRYQFF